MVQQVLVNLPNTLIEKRNTLTVTAHRLFNGRYCQLKLALLQPQLLDFKRQITVLSQSVHVPKRTHKQFHFMSQGFQDILRTERHMTENSLYSPLSLEPRPAPCFRHRVEQNIQAFSSAPFHCSSLRGNLLHTCLASANCRERQQFGSNQYLLSVAFSGMWKEHGTSTRLHRETNTT